MYYMDILLGTYIFVELICILLDVISQKVVLGSNQENVLGCFTVEGSFPLQHPSRHRADLLTDIQQDDLFGSTCAAGANHTRQPLLCGQFGGVWTVDKHLQNTISW